MSLKNTFGKKASQIYRISLKALSTREETQLQQAQFERDLRLWLKDEGAYQDGTVAFVRRGTPDAGSGGNVVIKTTPEKIAAIREKFATQIGGIHIGKMSDVLGSPKPNQPRP